MRHQIVVESIGTKVSIKISDKERYLSEATFRVDLTEEEANYLQSEIEHILDLIASRVQSLSFVQKNKE